MDGNRDIASSALPLTAPQYGMWLAQQFDPDSPALWTAEALEFRGAFDASAFEVALRQAVSECESLHMRCIETPHGVVQTQQCVADWPLVWLESDSARTSWQSARDWMQRDLAQPADLERGPLFGSAVLRLGEQHALWYLRAHHIALDGFGYTLLIRRVAELHNAIRRGMPPPPGRSFALAPLTAEDQAYRASAAFLEARQFWKARLEHAPEPAMLAAPTPPARGVQRALGTLPTVAYDRWQTTAAAVNVDWASWLLAAIAAWLYRTSGITDIGLGLLVMNRLGSAALAVPCMAMNVVPLRVRIEPGMNVAELARSIAAELRAIRPHQRYSYDEMRRDLGIEDDSRRMFGPIVNLMLFDKRYEFADLQTAAHPISSGQVEDLDITVSPGPTGVRLDFDANPDAYDATTLHRHRCALLAVLEQLTGKADIALDQWPPFQ